MTERCRVSEEELQYDWVTAQTPKEAAVSDEIKRQAFDEHVDFIMSTDASALVDALHDNEQAQLEFLHLCTFDINKRDMKNAANLTKLGILALSFIEAVEAEIREVEHAKHEQ